MSKVTADKHAALPAPERVAPTKRAAQAELSSLHAIADRERVILAMRRLLDPDEILSNHAEWEARALSRYDTAKAVATQRNEQRFGAFTFSLLREVGALPSWTGTVPPVVREAAAAAGLLPKLNGAFERSAELARESITIGVTGRRAT